MNITLQSERLTAEQYIDFLRRTDLGSQYPLERFEQRIARLVSSASISLTARNEEGLLVGVCFAITDFAYWLFITDLGVDRTCVGQGVGTQLLRKAHELAGGEQDIAMYTVANDKAIPFYRKLGFTASADVMEYNRIEWTGFTVE